MSITLQWILIVVYLVAGLAYMLGSYVWGMYKLSMKYGESNSEFVIASYVNIANYTVFGTQETQTFGDVRKKLKLRDWIRGLSNLLIWPFWLPKYMKKLREAVVFYVGSHLETD